MDTHPAPFIQLYGEEFILKLPEKILPAGSEYIRQDALLQADGPVNKSGRHHDRIAGFQFRALSLKRVPEASGKDVTALGMGMGMTRSDRAGLE